MQSTLGRRKHSWEHQTEEWEGKHPTVFQSYNEAEWYMGQEAAARCWAGFFSFLNLYLLICEVNGLNQRILKTPV